MRGGAGADPAIPHPPRARVHRGKARHAGLDCRSGAAPATSSVAAGVRSGDRDGMRATRQSARGDEHDHLGSLIHVDVKNLGRIPDGEGWRCMAGAGTRTGTAAPVMTTSTTTPASPTRRSTTTREAPPQRASWSARSRAAPPSTSRLNESSATTRSPTVTRQRSVV